MAGPKWTPGPWKAGVGSITANNRTILLANAPGFNSSEQMAATVRLAAAAPDLYEALLRLVETFEQIVPLNPDQVDYGAYKLAVEALSKAREG